MTIFLRDVVRVPRWQALPAALAVAAVPRMRRLVPCQIDDAIAINQLGVRLDTYAHVDMSTCLLCCSAARTAPATSATGTPRRPACSRARPPSRSQSRATARMRVPRNGLPR